MPKSKDKRKERKRKSTEKTNTTNKKMRKITNNVNSEEGIKMSKQLSVKKRISCKRIRSCAVQNYEPRLCGNGKPMPSLAELEKMYEDSENDEMVESTPVLNLGSYKTPHNDVVENQNILSPTIINKVAERLIDLVAKPNFPYEIIQANEGDPPPVIPVKRPKKSGIPYIVGCKDRPQVTQKPSTNFCKGDSDFGISSKTNEFNKEDENNKNRCKRSRSGLTISKSIFNAQVDKISEMCKENEIQCSSHEESSDSNETIIYEYDNSDIVQQSKSFSPLPSTSTDNDIIGQNDMKFQESFIRNCSNNDCVVVCDDDNDDKICTVADNELSKVDFNKKQPLLTNTIKIIDDIYDSVDLSMNYDTSDEIIDVDKVIAENEKLIQKYKGTQTQCIANFNSPIVVVDDSVNLHNDQSLNNDVVLSPHVDCTSESVNSAIPHKLQIGLDPESRIINLEKNTPIINLTSRGTTPVQVDSPEIITIDLSPELCESIINISSPHTSKRNSRHRALPNSRRQSAVTSTPVISNYQRTRARKLRSQSVTSPVPTQQATTSNELPKVPPQSSSNRPSSPNTLLQLQTSVNSPNDNRKSLGDCPICMENLANNTIASTPCGHLFCMKCIKAALKSSGKRCPNCRKVLKGVGYHQIFL